MNEIGKRYDRLTVIEKLDKKDFTNSVYLCKCDCGNMKGKCQVKFYGAKRC